MSALSDLLPISPGGGSGPVTVNTLSELQTATDGQKVFDLKQISFRPGYDDLVVVVNGVTQAMNSGVYAENSSSRITMVERVNSNDQMDFSIIRAEEETTSFRYFSELQTATDGQTSFDLLQIKYRFGYQDLAIIINGVTQARSPTVYTETSGGIRVILLEGLNGGDQVCFVIVRVAS